MSRETAATGRHRTRAYRAARRARRRPLVLAATATAAVAVGAGVLVGLAANGPAAATQQAHAAGAHSVARTSTPTPTPVTPTPSASDTTAAASPALLALRTLVATRSGSSTSVAALDTVTGATATAGADGGMTTASAVKVELLESLLLKRQDAGQSLDSSELASATAMIEHSDNSAAEAVFWDVGGHDAVAGFENDLGLSRTLTVLGSDDYWGLTTTSATQQLVLLRNLVISSGPLDAKSRALALGLMRNVEADQTWGVPVTATSGRSAVKNGWLNVDSDGGLWAVNSLGVVTIDGDTTLIAVMTQHNDSYADGVTRVQRVARAAAAAVRS